MTSIAKTPPALTPRTELTNGRGRCKVMAYCAGKNSKPITLATTPQLHLVHTTTASRRNCARRRAFTSIANNRIGGTQALRRFLANSPTPNYFPLFSTMAPERTHCAMRFSTSMVIMRDCLDARMSILSQDVPGFPTPIWKCATVARHARSWGLDEINCCTTVTRYPIRQPTPPNQRGFLLPFQPRPVRRRYDWFAAASTENIKARMPGRQRRRRPRKRFAVVFLVRCAHSLIHARAPIV